MSSDRRYALRHKSYARRDKNEPEIIEALQAYGVVVTRIAQTDVPDLACRYGNVRFWVEVKKPGGKLSDGQKAFIDAEVAAGCPAFVAQSADDIPDMLKAVSRWYTV